MIRAARPDEGERLREIAKAAKGYWGYDADLLEGWISQEDFTPASPEREFYVAEENGRAIAFSSLIPRGETCWLEDLWVEPESIGSGVGTQLFRHAVERARELGASMLEWEADPNAVGFYERMGGRRIRDSEVSEFGRVLPVMALNLD